jgi:hypothetical protein
MKNTGRVSDMFDISNIKSIGSISFGFPKPLEY